MLCFKSNGLGNERKRRILEVAIEGIDEIFDWWKVLLWNENSICDLDVCNKSGLLFHIYFKYQIIHIQLIQSSITIAIRKMSHPLVSCWCCCSGCLAELSQALERGYGLDWAFPQDLYGVYIVLLRCIIIGSKCFSDMFDCVEWCNAFWTSISNGPIQSDMVSRPQPGQVDSILMGKLVVVVNIQD